MMKETVVGIVAGEKTLDAQNLLPGDWATLILSRCERLKPHLADFWMLKPISQLMTGYFTQISRREWHVDARRSLNQPATFTLLNFNSLKQEQGITQLTRIVPLFYVMNAEANGYGGAIILTEKGTLHEWKWYGKNVGRHDQEITHADIRPFTMEEMRQNFKAGSFKPYTIFHNLSHLPQVQVKHMRTCLESVEEMSGSFIGLCGLIEPVR